MSEPKLLQITKELSARLGVIKKADGYHTDLGNMIFRGRLIPQENDCPMAAVTLRSVEVQDDSPVDKLSVNVEIEITGFEAFKDQHPEDIALKMAQDIHRAIELPINPVGRTDNIIRRVKYQGDAVDYPESAGNIVSVTVPYQFSFSRPYGDPVT